MGIGLSILLIAIGAILTFAVHTGVSGVSLHTVGIILMIVGGLGFVATFTFWGLAGRQRTQRRSVIAHSDGTTSEVDETIRHSGTTLPN